MFAISPSSCKMLFSIRGNSGSILFMIILLAGHCSLETDALLMSPTVKHYKLSNLQMMAGGFGSSNSKGSASKSSEKRGKSELKISSGSSGSKSASKDDGASYVKHCPSMNRKYLNIRCVHNDPPIFEIDDFMSAKVCDEFIQRADKEGVVVPSQTFSADSGSKRTSSTWYLPYDAVPELLDGASRLTGLTIPTFEEPQVVRYEIGQQFSWHYDSIPKSLQV